MEYRSHLDCHISNHNTQYEEADKYVCYKHKYLEVMVHITKSTTGSLMEDCNGISVLPRVWDENF